MFPDDCTGRVQCSGNAKLIPAVIYIHGTVFATHNIKIFCKLSTWSQIICMAQEDWTIIVHMLLLFNNCVQISTTWYIVTRQQFQVLVSQVLTYPAEVTVHSLTQFEFHSEVEAVVH